MSIPNFIIVESIWRQSGVSDSYAFLSTMHRPEGAARGHWEDYGFIPREGETFPLEHQPHQHDLFFSPLRFSNLKRANDRVELPGILFADLDDAPTDYKWEPTILWETSPGNRQAVWFLNRKIEDYDEWANLNKRMTYATRADRGGWMGSKVLRVPGSVNWKRRDFGRVLWYRPHLVHSVEALEVELPGVSVGDTLEVGDHPAIPKEDEAKAYIRSRWDDITLQARSMLMKSRVRDRSLHIVRTVYALMNCGMSPEDCFVMVWWRPWNKWRHRQTPDVLWRECIRAAEESSG